MVTHISQSIQKLNEKKQQEQNARDEVTEIRDAVVEVAELVAELYTAANTNNDNKEDGGNG